MQRKFFVYFPISIHRFMYIHITFTHTFVQRRAILSFLKFFEIKIPISFERDVATLVHKTNREKRKEEIKNNWTKQIYTRVLHTHEIIVQWEKSLFFTFHFQSLVIFVILFFSSSSRFAYFLFFYKFVVILIVCLYIFCSMSVKWKLYNFFPKTK